MISYVFSKYKEKKKKKKKKRKFSKESFFFLLYFVKWTAIAKGGRKEKGKVKEYVAMAVFDTNILLLKISLLNPKLWRIS